MAAASQDHGAKQSAAGGGAGEPKGKRAARAARADAGDEGGSRSKKGRVSSTPAAAVTVEDTDFLDCGVCFLPLKRPIFQCDIGHVVCSPCHEKLKATGKCHVCGVATGSYRRCHAMEQLLDSIRVTCPYANHGCGERPAYHDRESHRLACVHAPCHCSGENCNFVGLTAALLDHFTAAHSWPCITDAIACVGMLIVRLHDGFNFFLADADCPTAKRRMVPPPVSSVCSS